MGFHLTFEHFRAFSELARLQIGSLHLRSAVRMTGDQNERHPGKMPPTRVAHTTLRTAAKPWTQKTGDLLRRALF